jgi:hypothetical protein
MNWKRAKKNYKYFDITIKDNPKYKIKGKEGGYIRTPKYWEEWDKLSEKEQREYWVYYCLKQKCIKCGICGKNKVRDTRFGYSVYHTFNSSLNSLKSVEEGHLAICKKCYSKLSKKTKNEICLCGCGG